MLWKKHLWWSCFLTETTQQVYGCLCLDTPRVNIKLDPLGGLSYFHFSFFYKRKKVLPSPFYPQCFFTSPLPRRKSMGWDHVCCLMALAWSIVVLLLPEGTSIKFEMGSIPAPQPLLTRPAVESKYQPADI